MNEPTEIKYPLDDNGEPYFAATHIDAVQGLKKYLDIINEQDEKIKALEKLINKGGD